MNIRLSKQQLRIWTNERENKIMNAWVHDNNTDIDNFIIITIINNIYDSNNDNNNNENQYIADLNTLWHKLDFKKYW